LRGIEIDELALRLLTAAISVCFARDLGADDDGKKNFRDIALWIARNLLSTRDRELALKIGVWGINRLLSLPMFVLGPELVLTDQLDTFLNDAFIRAIKANPLLTPSAAPPQPWTGVRKGGLPAGHWAQPPLIRDHHPSIENAARKAIGTGRMKLLLDAIHALQTVPFTINLPVLHFLRRWNPPPMPVAPDKSKLTPGQYWHARKKHSEALAERTAWDLIVTTAEAMPERFCVPLNIDFRGRIYPIPHFNFTRDDRVRGLFLFADGKPIGAEGLLWLKAHVAARADGVAWSDHVGPRLGELDFKERIAWTDTNSELLLKIGKAVLEGNDPATLDWALRGPHKGDGHPKLIDEPIQFLAACAELVQAWDNPEFVTRLPLTFDASCSGLQHLCAMTRDEEGARYVNLIPSVYRPPTEAEADAIRDIIGAPTEESDDAHQVADDFYKRVSFRVWWRDKSLLKQPFERKYVKQPAMSYFYGAKAGGFAKDKKGEWHTFGITKQVIDAGYTGPAKKLADAIFNCIEDMLPRPKAVRDWLEQHAKLAAEKGKPLRLTTPLGLPVINIYQPAKVKNLSVVVNDRWRSVKLVVGDKDGINKEKAVNAIAANFVHSIDAAHLQLVALAAAKEGINMVGVHDCFGTIARHAGRLNDIVRDQFVNLHKRRNWLSNIWASAKRDGIELPPFSNIGTLDLEQVRKSFFAYR
jgi:DNA-directed RNA polymerase